MEWVIVFAALIYLYWAVSEWFNMATSCDEPRRQVPDAERQELRIENVRLPWDTEATLRGQFEAGSIEGLEYSLRAEKV
jgi:hypothetical protein